MYIFSYYNKFISIMSCSSFFFFINTILLLRLFVKPITVSSRVSTPILWIKQVAYMDMRYLNIVIERNLLIFMALTWLLFYSTDYFNILCTKKCTFVCVVNSRDEHCSDITRNFVWESCWIKNFPSNSILMFTHTIYKVCF